MKKKGVKMEGSSLEKESRKEIIVTGRVQGVGFRYFTQRLAAKYQIRGRVKNLADGNVRVKAIGINLEAFLSELRKGPAFAEVWGIEIRELAEKLDYEDFRIE